MANGVEGFNVFLIMRLSSYVCSPVTMHDITQLCGFVHYRKKEDIRHYVLV